MNEVLRESERGQRKRVQVMVLSCWCHRQIQALLAAWLSSASHTISPLFAISPFSISLHLPPWCSDSRRDALFSLPIRQLPAILYIYHSPLFSLLLTEKKNDIWLTQALFSQTYPLLIPRLFTLFLFLHALGLSVFGIPSFCLSPQDLLIRITILQPVLL